MTAFIQIVLLFFLYSFIGWLWETIYCSLNAGHFVYRGFLIGPITPIYGFGILGVVFLLRPLHNQLLLLFIAAAILVTLLEYLTSYLLEKMFHASWWDYHNVFMNINGRVAVPISIFWGICCVVIVRFVHPQMLVLVQALSERFGFYLPVGLLMLMSMDMGYTLANLAGFQRAVQRLNQAVEQQKASITESLEQKKSTWQEYVSELPIDWQQLRDTLPKLNFHQRRLLKNFQKLQINEITNVQDLRRFVDELRKKRD
ncbi:putative ABC transporter permease [Enterococcus sp.]|uniref:putative ABC transporter permease n=1 Tax=Enterococcus sp. TaxID=35783 RepID=UPI0025BDC1EA|nr:putative ABC transporter permease [Enterococcus sp.]